MGENKTAMIDVSARALDTIWAHMSRYHRFGDYRDKVVAGDALIAYGDARAAEALREAATVAGSMAERPYDNEPEFSAVLAVEAAILALIKPANAEKTS